MGVFGVFGSREGVRATTNMQNMPTRVCFACLGCGVGRKTMEHKKHAQMGMFFVFLAVAAVRWAFIQCPGWWGLWSCWRCLVVS